MFDKVDAAKNFYPMSLHVGDEVTIHLHHSSDERGKPFNVVLTKVMSRASEYNADGKQTTPLIFWEPRELDIENFKQLYSPENQVDENGNLDMEAARKSTCCDASYVTNVIKRAPWRSSFTPINQDHEALKYSKSRGNDFTEWFMCYDRKGRSVRAHPMGLARAILSGLSGYNLPYGMSSNRFWKRFEQAGYPGVENADYASSRHNRWDNYIQIKPFRKWLLKNIDHVRMTESERRAESIKGAKEEYEDYMNDFRSDMRMEVEKDDSFADDFGATAFDY